MAALKFKTSKSAIRWYTDRAQCLGVSRPQIAAALGSKPNFVSMLRSERCEDRLSLDQINPFARACRLNEGEKFRLAWQRIRECHGQKVTIDADLIRDLILAVRHLPPLATV